MAKIKTSKKTTLVLNIILFSFLLIFFKVWHLNVVQKEKHIEESKRPQRRTVLQHPNRGAIYDRYNVPLAINRIKYNASIYYSHIRQIPYVSWDRDQDNKPLKVYKRKEYITSLSKLLAKELDLDAERIEDLIHSKASLLPHIPFVIKENISEDKYFKLRMLQRDWTGLHAEITPERYYPHEHVGCDIIGYMGKINQKEYLHTAREIKTLQDFLEKYENNENPLFPENYSTIDQIESRLNELKKLAYKTTDLVGKSGVEKSFDEKLKGYHEKKTFTVDIKGNFLKELPGSKNPTSGENLQLSISQELQEFAESLLAQDEKNREGVSKIYNSKNKNSEIQKQPWIKGGTIIAMDPKTGEIVALASYPRFNPNDFILSSNEDINRSKINNINRWFETYKHIANIWDGKGTLSRELYKNSFYEEEKALNWDLFLDIILPENSSIKLTFERIKNVKNAISLQEDIEALLYFSKQPNLGSVLDILYKSDEGHIPTKTIELVQQEKIVKNLQEHKDDVYQLKKRITRYLSPILNNKDKIFAIDLCRLAVYSPAFPDDLIDKVKQKSLNEYWTFSKSVIFIKDEVKEIIKPLFCELFFKKWREENQKDFLKEKRNLEKEKGTYAKPYIDYLDQKQNELFLEFWKKNQTAFITYLLKGKIQKNLEILSYIEKLDQWKKPIPKDSKISIELAKIQNETKELDYSSTYYLVKTVRSFFELDRPLLGKYNRLRKSVDGQYEKHLAASFYPINGYHYGRSYGYRYFSAPGSIFKIVIAYAALKQRYNYLKQYNFNFQLNPLTIIDDIYWDSKYSKKGSLIVGLTPDKKPYPRFYKGGRLPHSAHPKMGEMNLISAIEQSSNPYFAILAGDIIESPQYLLEVAKDFGFAKKTDIDLPGEIKGQLSTDIDINKTGLYSFAIGQHTLITTPLQMAVFLSSIANEGYILKPNILKSETAIINNQIFMPKEIRQMILEGLDRVVSGEKGSARPSIIKKFYGRPTLKEYYKNLSHQFVGKTSSAEFTYNPNSNPSSKAEMFKNIWFGSIAFQEPKSETYSKKDLWQNPELVVIVSLCFGDGGKEAAPIAAQIVKKYREIKEKYRIENSN